MKTHEITEDAVSPVIGVMLMIVITVVIAGVITAFATGMTEDSTTTTPMALFEADNYKVGDDRKLKSFDLVHKGGDEVSLENVQIMLEPGASGQGGMGIILIKTAGTSDVKTASGNPVLSTGNRIKIAVDTNNNIAHNGDDDIFSSSPVKWTLSDIRTNGVIAKGEFIVPEP